MEGSKSSDSEKERVVYFSVIENALGLLNEVSDDNQRIEVIDNLIDRLDAEKRAALGRLISSDPGAYSRHLQEMDLRNHPSSQN